MIIKKVTTHIPGRCVKRPEYATVPVRTTYYLFGIPVFTC